MKTIRYGIDLGTTNSLIARFDKGKLELFRNPVGFRDALPSCIAFRGNRTIVGDKARELISKDPVNVFSSFKRKMGSDEVYFIPSLAKTITPVNLSSLVLKELLHFIPGGEKPSSVVITIPASFDTVQSNATKEAGYEAGFEEIILLQEPIAASLAFFNQNNNNSKEKGVWMVYDLGGGTFDAAIVSINEGDMRVRDHQGNNFLGGVDLDHLLVMKLLLPKLRDSGFNLPEEESILRNGHYETLFYILLLKAEEAKKELSVVESTLVDIDWESANGEFISTQIEIFRSEFESLISDTISKTIDLMDELVRRAGMSYAELEEVILIGGSTLIPLVGKTIYERTGVKVNNLTDPTTAVVIGAAYYAGAKPSSLIHEIPDIDEDKGDWGIEVRLAWNKNTKDKEEYISVELSDVQRGLQYRIIRQDGGFDTGFREASVKFGEFVSLREGTINSFTLKFYDDGHNLVYEYPAEIEIVQGIYNLLGQPLPEDICLELDDTENNITRCELIFARNSILPLKKTIYKEISRYISKNGDDALIFQLLEGDHTNHPAANKSIGVIEIKSSALHSDLVKGSEVEIQIEISESRDVSVSVHLGFTNQVFQEVFTPTQRSVSLAKLREDLRQMKLELDYQLNKAKDIEDYVTAASVDSYLKKTNHLLELAEHESENSKSDLKYQLEDDKRALSKYLFNTEKVSGKTMRLLENYYSWKHSIEYWINVYDDIPEIFKSEYEGIRQKETSMFPLQSYANVSLLKSKIDSLVNKMAFQIPAITLIFFEHYSTLDRSEYSNYNEAQKHIIKGQIAVEKRDHLELKLALKNLLNLTNGSPLDEAIKGTGLR
jgi:molecular chaperone DnaK